MLGNLFYRGVAPAELRAMPWPEICYWNEWHDKIEKATKDAMSGGGK